MSEPFEMSDWKLEQWLKALLRMGIILLCCVCITVPYPAVAAPNSVEELQQQQQQIEQQRSGISRERDRLQNIERAAKGQLGLIHQTIQVTATQIKDYEYQLQLAKKNLKELQEDLLLANKNYQQKQSAAVARLQFLQRQQRRQGWAVLLQSHNLNEFLDRRRQLKLVYRADQRTLAQLKGQTAQIKEQRLVIEQQKNQIALLTQQLLARKAEFEGQAKSQQELITRLKSDQTALEAAEAQLARDSASVGELIQKRVAEQRAREAEDRKARRPSPIVVQGTGQMSYPCDAPITSNFGWRIHPILGSGRFHAGLDFGADYGTTIRAADSGRVILADWYGGYGNAIVIDHGNGITTLYGHASELFVSEGQNVQRGQAIAAVGSTGLSTGPHLHFEVRQDGEPTDPMSYL